MPDFSDSGRGKLPQRFAFQFDKFVAMNRIRFLESPAQVAGVARPGGRVVLVANPVVELDFTGSKELLPARQFPPERGPLDTRCRCSAEKEPYFDPVVLLVDLGGEQAPRPLPETGDIHNRIDKGPEAFHRAGPGGKRIDTHEEKECDDETVPGE